MRLLSGQGDVTAPFSSRGGAGQTLGISKPDVAAPGVDILAGYSGKLAVPTGPDGQIFNILSGTSMASPHVAGAAALLKQLHPDWGPGDIKSALMMTATDAVVKEDGVTKATPFDVGTGRIDLARAGDAGLLISETAENFLALQSNLSVANYPSLYLPVMPGKVVVPRRVVNAIERPPRLRRLAGLGRGPGRRADLRAGPARVPPPEELPDVWIWIDASQVPLDEVRHARVLFSHRSGHDHHGSRRGKPEADVLAFPITLVKKQGGVTLLKACDDTDLALGESTQCTVSATNTTFDPARSSSATGCRRSCA